MVLASNEWLGNCDDDQRSAAANTTTVTTTTTTNTATGTATATNTNNTTTATATVGVARSTVNSTILPNVGAAVTLQTTTTATTPAEARNDNDNNRQTIIDSVQSINDNSEILLQEIRLSMLNPSSIEIMADDNTSETLKDSSTNSESEIVTSGIGSRESVTNNNAGYISDESLNSSSSPPDNMINSSSNTSLNSSTNSNTNAYTLEAEIVLQAQANAAWANTAATKEALPLSSPITPQALSSALQSVMNATNNANVAASNLQNNFLSSLGIEEVALRETAKQLTSSFLESANTGKPQTNLNSSDVSENDSSGQAKIVLLCEANSHPFQTRTIQLTPNIECKVGRLIAKSKASESNAIFDCKVLSRNHAVLWHSDDGKFWVKDTKSSNGTFINENKLGNEAAELHFGDIVKFGVDVLENSRKEVHGCIIAFVKLYLPDGREAISIDSIAQRSQYSGEGRISYDEMHRLNLYMQEASQREKVLKSKLFNLQNVLDATRKNSALCWQSLIAEDQLLHRIHSLEKKLQVMEKNVPESALRNEILKLLEDKNSYQLTAKEALRKVYQERCDALQMLAKVESAYASSDNECKILRDQIMNSKQALQDMNTRLQHLETDFNEYRDEAERKQQEAKEHEEQRILELTEKLQQRELECSELKRRISDLLIRRAELLDDEEKLQEQQAFEKLDAAIADMDLGEDDDDEDDAEEANDTNDVINESKKKKRKDSLSGGDSKNDSANVLNDSSNSSGGSEKGKLNASHNSDTDDGPPHKEAKEKVAKESTIMKWLQNSDLNTKEGSLDIFKAICNESDSSDEQEATSPGDGDGSNKRKLSEDFDKKCVNFTNKLKNVQMNLRQLEAEIANETTKVTDAISSLDDGSTAVAMDSDEEEDAVIDEVAKRNGQLNDLLAKDNQSYLLLKRSVNMLREAYNDICDSVKQQQEQMQPKTNAKKTTPPPAISVKTQFENYSPHKPSNSAAKKLETQETLKPLLETTNEDEPDTDEEEDDDIDEDEISDAATQRSGSSRNTIREGKSCGHLCDEDICEYKKQIEELSSKLVQIENDSQNTLEIMQVECDSFKDKVSEMSKLIETLRVEKEALEQVVNENTTDVPSSKGELENTDKGKVVECVEVLTVTTTTTNKAGASFEQQMCEDLAAINNSTVQHEEELIMYKERLEQTQTDNVSLRKEIAQLKRKSHDHTRTLVKRVLPYGAAVIAILVYFVTTYF